MDYQLSNNEQNVRILNLQDGGVGKKKKKKSKNERVKNPAHWRAGWGLTKGVNMKAEGEEWMGQGGQ